MHLLLVLGVLVAQVHAATQFLAYPGYDAADFACHYYPILCNNTMQDLGCNVSEVVGCPNYPQVSGDLPNFVGKCICLEPYYYGDSSQRIAEEIVINRIQPDVWWLMEPWQTGPPYNFLESYVLICNRTLHRLDCPPANWTVSVNSTYQNGDHIGGFVCACGNFTAASYMINAMMIDNVNNYNLVTMPIWSNPIYLSVPVSLCVVFLVGKLFAIIAVYCQLPAIVGFLMAGLALQNCVSPMFLTGAGYPYPSPASELKVIALLIILMRAGLALNLEEVKATTTVTTVLSVLPYMGEFFTIMLLAHQWIGGWSILEAGLLASIMAPLGPSIVIGTMLGLINNPQKKDYGYPPRQTVLSAPIEAVLSIVLFEIFANLLQTSTPALYPWVKILPLWLNLVLVPVNILFSCVLGVIIGLMVSRYIHYRVQFKSDYVWTKVNSNPQLGSSTADLVFIFFVLCYTLYSLSNQQYIQQCSGVLVVFVAAITVSVDAPEKITTELAVSLKGVWVFAEVILFTLTGMLVQFDDSDGPLYGQRGLSADQMGVLIQIIFLGLLGRFLLLIVSMCFIYPTLPPHRKDLKKWFLPFFWTMYIFMIAKATVQATMGGVAYAQHIIPGAQGLNQGEYISIATAVTVLICGPLGTILVKFVGGPISLKLTEYDKECGWDIIENKYDESSKFFAQWTPKASAPQQSGLLPSNTTKSNDSDSGLRKKHDDEGELREAPTLQEHLPVVFEAVRRSVTASRDTMGSRFRPSELSMSKVQAPNM